MEDDERSGRQITDDAAYFRNGRDVVVPSQSHVGVVELSQRRIDYVRGGSPGPARQDGDVQRLFFGRCHIVNPWSPKPE